MNSFIFIGRSGCGKGTQADLLQKHLESQGESILYIETGEKFRKFFTEDGYTNTISRRLYESGERQPDFLACDMWTHILMDSFGGEQSVIFDGTSRSLSEAKVLDTALEFFGFKNKIVVYINVSREWSKKHLMARKRFDDVDAAEIEKRLDWFEKDAIPAIKSYQDDPSYSFFEIQGEAPIDAVSLNLIAAIKPIVG